MKSINKLMRRFIGIMTISLMLLIALNVILLGIVVSTQSSYGSPWDTANEVASDLHVDNQEYTLSAEVSTKLEHQNIWAILIDNHSQETLWQTRNLPENIPMKYSLSDIANLTRGYVNGYPTFTGEREDGLIVLGYPADSFWKHMRASWDYRIIANSPLILLLVCIGNLVVIFLIYMVVNAKLMRSIKPVTSGIQDLSIGNPIHINEKGLLSELAENINKASIVLQEQREQLEKKDLARANWIAGVSHDIRTPLSMVMGYAGQLESNQNLSEIERKKATIILKQSDRMRNLISDLNLVSKLEYTMQPIIQNSENIIAIVRQVVVDFMNLNIDNKYPLIWKTSQQVSTCIINVNKDLIKRAITNLIQNSIRHNEHGCSIYVTIEVEQYNCIICIEDSGIGASDKQMEALNEKQHYMVCDENMTEQRHGLGLLIVHQIMIVHHGKMEFSLSSYGGMKVVLYLPK